MFFPTSVSPARRPRPAAPPLSAARFPLASLAAFALAATSAHAASTRPGFERPAAPRPGPAPFLTEAVAWDFPKYSQMSRQLVYPTKIKAEAPFNDVPFAVNIPFEVPFDGGTVRVFFDVNVVWGAPEQAAQLTSPGYPPRPLIPPDGRNWHLYRQGIYRMDGAAIAPGTATWEEGGLPGSPPMNWQTDAPFPLMLAGALPTASTDGDGITRLDISSVLSTPKPRRPFTNRNDEHDGFMLDRPLVLRPATPGWYALWFTLSPMLSMWPPQPLRADDTLRARIIVHTMVARRERFNNTGGYFTRPDLAWLWEGATAPATRPIDPNLVRAHTVEIPLTLRRDGWVFDRAEVKRARPADDFLDKKLPARDSGELAGAVIKAGAQSTAQGMKASYESSVFERKDRADPFPAQPSRVATMTWDIAFPKEIMDDGAGLIVAGGGITKTGGDAAFRNRVPVDFHQDFLPRWIHEPAAPDPDPRGLGGRLEIIRNYSAGNKAGYLSSWGWKLGDPDGSRFWQVAEGGGPPAAGQAMRFILVAKQWNPTYVTAFNRGSLPMLYQDLGPQPLFRIDAGPWRVEAHYRRKKDPEKIQSGSAPTAGPATLAEEKDEFWAWFPSYSRLLRETEAVMGQLTNENALDRVLMLSARHRARLLLDAFQTANDPGSFSDWFASGGTRATMSDAMVARLAASAGKANTEAFAHKTAIQQRVEKMRAARGAVLAELKRVFPKFIDRHPELALWERDQRARLESIDIHAALGTGDLGLFQAVMARASAQPASLQPEALLALAQLQQENGDPAGALESLRIVARQQPENLDAAERLRDLECSFIKVALDKSQGAIAQARKHFYGYLSERGFGEKDQAWVGGMRARGLSSFDGESAWAVFTTGVTGSISGLLGRADEEARALDATERDLTVAFLGAHSILRLRMRGHALAEIKSLTTAQIQEELTRGAPNAPPMPRERALEFGLAMHHAFQLPELQALLGENSDDLRRGLAQGYWNAKDVGNTWAEWVGDLTSPKNLVMLLLPMSIGRVGGQLQGAAYWTRAEAAFLQGATRTGYVDTGTMVVARMLHWDRALGALGATERGQKFIRLLERSQQYQESLGLLGQAGWTIGKMVATMGLQGLAVHEAEELGGPRAALLMECLLLFGGDTDLLVKFLDGARISRQTAWLAAKETVFTLEKQQRALLAMKEQAIEAAHAMELRRLGKKNPPRRHPPQIEPPAEVPLLPGPPPVAKAGEIPTPPLRDGNARPKTPPVPRIGGAAPPAGRAGQILTPPVGGGSAGRPKTPVVPRPGGAADAPALGPVANHRHGLPSGPPGNDAGIALAALEEGVDQGSNNGAIGAVQDLLGDVDDEIRQLGERGQQLKKIADAIEQAPPAGPLPERPPGTGRFLPRDEGGNRLPPQPSELNETWLAAELALFAGDYEAAEQGYRRMLVEFARDAQAGKPLGPAALPPVMIKHRLEQARELLRIPPDEIDRAASAGILRAIPDAEVDAILAMPRGAGPPPGAAGSIAPTKGRQFMIKEVLLGGKLTTSAKELERMVQGEVISAELNALLGQATPGLNVKARWAVGEGGKAEMQAASLIYRYVPGSPLDALPAAKLFHVRDQMAEHRVLATLLGDYDRKPDNYKIFNGVVHAIDGGQADIMALRALEFGPKVHPATIGGIGGNDHWYVSAFQELNDPTRAAAYQKILLSEMSLTYQAAERGIAKVKGMLGNPELRATTKERLRAAFGRVHKDNPDFRSLTREQLDLRLNQMAEDTLEAMDLRLPATLEAMKTLNDRNGIPLPPGLKSPRHSSLWWPRAVPPRRGGELLPFPPERKLAA